MAKPQPEFRVRFVVDQDWQFEESNGENRPLTEEEYKGNEYRKECPACHGTGKLDPQSTIAACLECKGQKMIDIPYDEYLEYYGNPDRHVGVFCEVQRKCPCCKQWENVGGTGGIDMMDDSSELVNMDQWFTPSELLATWNLGYFREVAMEDLEEAGWKPPRHVYCAKPRCKYHHVAGSKFCAQHGGEHATA